MADQHNPLAPTPTPAVEGRSYDGGQVVGVTPEGEPIIKGTIHGSAPSEMGHAQILEVRDRRYHGPKALAEATLDDVVYLEGLGSMEFRSAINAGFLSPDVLQGQQPAPTVQPKPPEATLDAPPVSDSEQQVPEGEQGDTEADQSGTEELMTGTEGEAAEATIETFAAAADDGMKAELVDAATTGEVPNDLMERAGELVGGIENAQAVEAGLRDQARQAIAASTGLEGDAVAEFADRLRADHPEEFASAIKQQLTERDLTGYRRLASQVALADTEWTAEGEGPPFGEGVAGRRGPNGTTLVTAHGREMLLQDAVALGIVTVSRNT